MIQKIIIKNFKLFTDFKMEINENISIIVGDNEQGKSTILEAINLALKGQINGRHIQYELNTHLFNKDIVEKYISKLKRGVTSIPPKIVIELFLADTEQTAFLKGTNNSLKEDACGINMCIEFDEEYSEEYKEFISKKNQINSVPVEYYSIKWYSFAFNSITSRSIPIGTVLIDTTLTKSYYGANKYISNIINDYLDPKEKVDLTLNYRLLKESFSEVQSIKSINSKLTSKKGEVSDKELKISLDVSQKNGWESSLTTYLDDIPIDFIGKGEQNALKMKLALETKAKEAQVILLEEPENHLSFSNMNKLIKDISEKCSGRQLIITTHSTFVLNKLGIQNVILLNDKKVTSLAELDEDTYNYFKKLPGYETLRLLLAKKAILVEGPSDELIVQKAYVQKYKKLPIEDGVDVLSVKALSFKRFLSVAAQINKEVRVVTDNDGDVDALERKYIDYLDGAYPNIQICFDEDTDFKTLEPQLLKVNGLKKLNKILGKKYRSEERLLSYMEKNKTDCALKIFETSEQINIPEYITNAIEK